MAWEHFSELIVWQKAMDLTDEIYKLVKKLPREEVYGISDQMRRAAVSVPSNIAEGHRRRTHKEFAHFLYIASGSVAELETQLLICIRQTLLTRETADYALRLCDEVGRMLTSFIKSIEE